MNPQRVPQFAGQITTTHGSMARMMITRALAVAALTLATFATTTATSEAKQPSPRCHDKVKVSTMTFDDGTTWRVTNFTTRCRGKVVGGGQLWEPIAP